MEASKHCRPTSAARLFVCARRIKVRKRVKACIGARLSYYESARLGARLGGMSRSVLIRSGHSRSARAGHGLRAGCASMLGSSALAQSLVWATRDALGYCVALRFEMRFLGPFLVGLVVRPETSAGCFVSCCATSLSFVLWFTPAPARVLDPEV